jgi:hypothetical protein
MTKRNLWTVLVVAIAALAATGVWALKSPPRVPAVPEELTTRAEVPGIPGARYWVMGGYL